MTASPLWPRPAGRDNAGRSSGLVTDLPAELALVLACCHWPPSPSRLAAVRAAASRPIDWDAFERVIARHRVVGLVHDGLRRAKAAVPPAVEQRQAQSSVVAGRTALAQARETLRLQDTFDEAGLPVVSVKGSSLALLAYGTLGIKESWDIDLLTTPEHAAAGRQLLLKLGYQMMMPASFDDLTFARFVEFYKEAIFFNSDLNLSVELHWRLTDNSALLPGISALSKTQSVALANRELRTLEDGALFAYLCAHGSRHGWARLKWLADVNAFLSSRDEADIERLYRNTADLRAGRSAAATLLLCRKLFGLPLPDRLVLALRADPFARALMTNSLHCIAYRRGEAEFSSYTTAGIRLFFSEFLIAPGARYFWNEMRSKWIHPIDAARIKLPRRLNFLLYLLRIPLWLGRKAKRVIRARSVS